MVNGIITLSIVKDFQSIKSTLERLPAVRVIKKQNVVVISRFKLAFMPAI